MAICKMPRCGHPTPSGPCERTVPAEADLCFMHDSSGPPRSHSAPTGNENAVGNSGGGAPRLNTNAAKHHGWSDPDKHYQRLEGDGKTWVDDRIAWYIEQANTDLSADEIEAKARRLATIDHQNWLTIIDTLDRGLSIEREETHNGQTITRRVANPAFKAGYRLSKQEWELLDDLGLGFGGDR